MKFRWIPIAPFLFVPVGVFVLLVLISIVLVYYTNQTVPPPLNDLIPALPKESFCASSGSGCRASQSFLSDTPTDCDANRRDYVLGYLGQPEQCPPKVSPRWTYWYYPNVMDHPCSDYTDTTTPKSSCGVKTTQQPSQNNDDLPFLFDPLDPAPSDCPIFPAPPYLPIGSDHLTIPDPF